LQLLSQILIRQKLLTHFISDDNDLLPQ